MLFVLFFPIFFFYSRRTLISWLFFHFFCASPMFSCRFTFSSSVLYKHTFRNGWSYWLLNAIGFLILLFFLSITWFKKLWILLMPINEDDPNLIELPTHRFLKYLFNTSKSVMSNAVARMLIYFVAVCVLTLSALIHLVRTQASTRVWYRAEMLNQTTIYLHVCICFFFSPFFLCVWKFSNLG